MVRDSHYYRALINLYVLIERQFTLEEIDEIYSQAEHIADEESFNEFFAIIRNVIGSTKEIIETDNSEAEFVLKRYGNFYMITNKENIPLFDPYYGSYVLNSMTDYKYFKR